MGTRLNMHRDTYPHVTTHMHTHAHAHINTYQYTKCIMHTYTLRLINAHTPATYSCTHTHSMPHKEVKIQCTQETTPPRYSFQKYSYTTRGASLVPKSLHRYEANVNPVTSRSTGHVNINPQYTGQYLTIHTHHYKRKSNYRRPLLHHMNSKYSQHM